MRNRQPHADRLDDGRPPGPMAGRERAEVDWHQIDLCDAAAVERLIRTTVPDAIVHFAEQRSAPYSMISPARVETQVNNVVGTLNVLYAGARPGTQLPPHQARNHG